MDSSSSDDDIPLSKIKARPKPQPTIKKRHAMKDEESSSSDDDTPLSQIIKRKAKKAPNKPSKKAKTVRTSTAKSESKSSSSNQTRKVPKKYEWSRVMALPIISSAELLKPQLVQQVIRRWNYCGIKWPPEDINDRVPKSKNYRPLLGFPGVFVGVKGSVVGLIKDYRPMKNRPCFSQFILKPSKELRDLWEIGVQAQMEDLIKVEGESAPTLTLLKEELKVCKKISDSRLLKADKNYERSRKSRK